MKINLLETKKVWTGSILDEDTSWALGEIIVVLKPIVLLN
ncbi:hypothetical protein NSP_35390 [Nodularia spumigena CCY9414]|nr:hypothetical protein NSP_35390 [Nodularia spumigena CCY9414]